MAPVKEMVKKEMDRLLDGKGNGYRLCILGDLNGWIGDKIRTGIAGAFAVPEENDNIMVEKRWSFVQKEWQGFKTEWGLRAR